MLSAAETAQLRRQALWSRLLAYPTYALIIAMGRLRFGYTFKDLERFRAELWAKLDAHPGPVIWAANHLTMIDSFLVFWAVFPMSRAGQANRLPWSTPEYRNYYAVGSPLKAAAVRTLMYLCRCIPFLREGEDEASVRWREAAFEKCALILKEGGSVFVYPEAGRARNGWLDSRKPKDFLGRLALATPGAKFLCVYLRGEGQTFATVAPRRGEAFRMHAELVDGVLPGETTPRAVSERLFTVLAGLQERWFAGSVLSKNCAGNDVVDLGAERHRENFDLESGEADTDWLTRHLSAKELSYFSSQLKGSRFRTFWMYFAAKEAAHKAFTQAGIMTPHGAFRMIEVDLFRRKALHRPTGAQADISFTDADDDKVHCLAVLRGGSVGDADQPGDVLWRVEEVPSGENPGDFARRRLLDFIAESADDIPSAALLAISEDDGLPRVLRRGKLQDWGVSLSHSGRYAAYSFMVS
ncbi:MAG: 1-acyl-sn-glycerol-3-phosphate acyltransferase [Elusimicrobia bacterium]|nr:1-acyl-sn-glycerol-3-phosphate acyltransferase [Elusimicrobiota bacterium]